MQAQSDLCQPVDQMTAIAKASERAVRLSLRCPQQAAKHLPAARRMLPTPSGAAASVRAWSDAPNWQPQSRCAPLAWVLS